MAENPDLWLTTRARVVLLTTSGVTLTDGFIETIGGVVTLRGSVESHGEMDKAASAVRGIDGVKGIRNFLRVVASLPKRRPTDQEIRDRVEQALQSIHA